MSDTLAPVVPIRPGLAARYGVTQAMNDISALLTAPAGLTADEVAAPVTQIVARTARSLARARMLTSEVTEDRRGMPLARVDAVGTVVWLSQDPDSPDVLVQLTTRDPDEAAGLAITIDGKAAGYSPSPVPIAVGRSRRHRRRSPARRGHGFPGTAAGGR
jgi:hypothetical protein